MRFKTFRTKNFEGTAELSEIKDLKYLALTTPVSPGQDWWYFNRLKVKDQYIGQGFGRDLMDQIIQWADSEKIFIFNEVSSYGRENGLEENIKFYEKFGFKLSQRNIMIRIPKE